MNSGWFGVALAIALATPGCTPKAADRVGDGTAASAGVATASVTPSNAAPDAAKKGSVQVVVAAEDSDALSEIRTKRLEAKAQGRVLVVYVGATWCEPCKRFKAELQAGRLDDRLAKVTLLAFDADKDIDRLGAAGYSFTFVPFVALPGADGHPTDTVQATGKGAQAWRDLLVKLDAWQR